MANSSPLNEVLDALAQCLSPEAAERVVNFRAPASVQAHIEDLASRNTEGELCESELAEYARLVSAGNLIAILQAKARRLLAEAHASREGKLPEWSDVYQGLTDDKLGEIESVIRERADLSRPS